MTFPIKTPIGPGGAGVGLKYPNELIIRKSVMTKDHPPGLGPKITWPGGKYPNDPPIFKRIHDTMIREIIRVFEIILFRGVEGEISIRETDPGYNWRNTKSYAI